MDSTANGNSARLTRLPLLAFTQLDKIHEAFHRELSNLIIGLAMIDEGLPLDGNLQHLVQSGAQLRRPYFHLTCKSLGNKDLDRVRLAIIGFPQVTDMAMRNTVTRDLRALLSEGLALPVRVNVDP